ncbi:MAG TPA: prepilin-type N-terminal cleavage/methylation domain-containing protein [Gemmatimonadaceae bacterium]|nr:prepilin-type N-terminal cleavage/methylation domain-containing protein [Gemmatimonadaceae bacterium]
MTRSPRRARRGFTLIEVLVATFILGGALLGLAAFGAKFAKATTSSSITQTATELAVVKLETDVKSRMTYVGIDSTRGREATIPGPQYAGYSRETLVTRIGGRPGVDSVDYKIVTVTVSHAMLRRPVEKSVIIPAF